MRLATLYACLYGRFAACKIGALGSLGCLGNLGYLGGLGCWLAGGRLLSRRQAGHKL